MERHLAHNARLLHPAGVAHAPRGRRRGLDHIGPVYWIAGAAAHRPGIVAACSAVFRRSEGTLGGAARCCQTLRFVPMAETILDRYRPAVLRGFWRRVA